MRPAASLPTSPLAPPPPPISTRRRALPRNAVFSLFDKAALGPPPELVWSFIDDDDVGSGVEAFLRATATDVEPRRLDALLLAEPGLRRADAALALAWRKELISGDPARIDAAARQARDSTGTDLSTFWPMKDGLVGTLAARSSASALVATLMQHAGLRDRLVQYWPEDRSQTIDGEELACAIDRFETAEADAFAAYLADADVQAGLNRMNAANRELATLLHVAGGKAAGLAITSPELGLATIDDAVDLAAALNAWRAARWVCHPDRPELSDPERSRRQHDCAAADLALGRKQDLLAVGAAQS